MRTKTKIKLTLLILATIAACLAVIAGVSFGWMAINRVVVGNVNSVSVFAGYDINVECRVDGHDKQNWEGTDSGNIFDIDFDAFISGKKQTMVLYIQNNENQDFNISLNLCVGQETPEVDDGKYYYFGSQIAITGIRLDESEVTNDAVNTYLVETTDEYGNQPTFVTAPVATPPAINLYGNLALASKTAYTLEVDFSFVDNNQDQSRYMTFGENGGDCLRYLQFIMNNIT